MLTYQDLMTVGAKETDRIEFVRKCIYQHKSSQDYLIARDADLYDKHLNVTIRDYQKLLYTITGKAVPDIYSANYKIASRFFNRFVVQETQYLLGNGITWKSGDEPLGSDFDIRLQEASKRALVCKVAFGFWNLDHVEVFDLLEFAPLYDEEDGALKAGVRFWQVAPDKPLRATLYELDGFTEYIWDDDDGSVLREKRPYVIEVSESEVDGTVIYDGENYPTFPIVPLWGNPHHQSELIGIREQIDAYDLIKSGFANNIDEASEIYWTIQNAGGMDDIDLVKFVERLHTVRAVAVDENGAHAESHTLDIPYAAREAILNRLRDDLYEDFMALDTKSIQGGATTATQIKAAYEPLNAKADQLEYCVHEFVSGLLKLAGKDDEATFTRSIIVNTQEEIQTLIQADGFLDSQYITKKILTLLGDADVVDEEIDKIDVAGLERMIGDEYEVVDVIDEDGNSIGLDT